MSIQIMFNSLKKYGFVQDADDLPPREWSDGRLHEKIAGEWHIVGSENQSSSENKSEASEKEETDKKTNNSKLKLLSDNIEHILNATDDEKANLQRTYYKLADTPQELKDKGLRGDYFTIKYGVISHHKNKDNDHNLSAEEWKEICKNITKPVAIVPYGDKKDSYNLFLDIKHNGKPLLVGVTVKNAGRNLEVNAVNTVFAKDGIMRLKKHPR